MHYEFLHREQGSHSSYAQIPLLNYVFCFIFEVKGCWLLATLANPSAIFHGFFCFLGIDDSYSIPIIDPNQSGVTSSSRSLPNLEAARRPRWKSRRGGIA